MKKALIIGVTVFSLMLFAGSAYATEGSSQTLVFPFICEVPAKNLMFTSEHLDMIFTIANVTSIDTNVPAFVRNFKGQFMLDYLLHLSPFDVQKETCLSVINKMSTPTQSQMIQTIGGKNYYVGYIKYDVENPAAGAYLIGWGEMETLSVMIAGGGKFSIVTQLFTNAGFNGVPDFYANVNAATNDINGQSWRIYTNQKLMPRFNIANANGATYNWWIIMTPSNAGTTVAGPCTRQMVGTICDENEHCLSLAIPLPYQVNIVNVANYLPGGVFPTSTFPKAGFGMFDVVLNGTSAPGAPGGNSCGNAGNEQYLGWSYQYTLGSFYQGKTALIFPMHRDVVILE
jgi:hypothetical protein